MTMVGRCCLCSKACPWKIGYVDAFPNINGRFLGSFYSVEFPSWVEGVRIPKDGDLGDDFDPTLISLVIIARPYSGYADLPNLAASIAFLETGGTILIIVDYTSVSVVGPTDDLPVFLDGLGVTMAFDDSGAPTDPTYYLPFAEELSTIHSHSLTTGISTYKNDAAGKLIPNSATPLISHSSGGPVVAVEEAHGGKVVVATDFTGSFIQHANFGTDSERLLHNIYYDATPTACLPDGRCTDIGYWGSWDLGTTLELPYGYNLNTNMVDADFSIPGLATVFMGNAPGTTLFDVPSTSSGSLEFLSNGGTIVLTVDHATASSHPFLTPANVAACNSYLSSIGASMRWDDTVGVTTGLSTGLQSPLAHPLTTGVVRLFFENTGNIIPNGAVALVRARRFTKFITPIVVEELSGGGRVIMIADGGFFAHPSAATNYQGNHTLLMNIILTQNC